VTQVVKPEPLAVLDMRSGLLCRRPEMIGDENRGGEGNTAARFALVLRVGALFSPWAQLGGQNRMQRNISVRRLRLGLTILAFRAERCSGAGQHQREVKRQGEDLQDCKRLGRRDDDGLVVGLRARLDLAKVQVERINLLEAAITHQERGIIRSQSYPRSERVGELRKILEA
jgi:hypothetical protein